jgi:hypothetical protein
VEHLELHIQQREKGLVEDTLIRKQEVVVQVVAKVVILMGYRIQEQPLLLLIIVYMVLMVEHQELQHQVLLIG